MAGRTSNCHKLFAVFKGGMCGKSGGEGGGGRRRVVLVFQNVVEQFEKCNFYLLAFFQFNSSDFPKGRFGQGDGGFYHWLSQHTSG